MPRTEYLRHVPKVDTTEDLAFLQSNIENYIDRLNDASPILDGRLVEGVELDAHTANDIQHKLNRKLNGYLVVKDNTPPCSARAYRAAALSISDNTNTKVTVDTDVYDWGNDFDVVTNNRFTAPVDGLYQFMGNVSYAGLADTETASCYLYKNGATVTSFGTRGRQGSSGSVYLTVADTLRLVAGDYIELWTNYDGASPTEALDLGAWANFLQAELIDRLFDGQDDSDVDETKILRLYSSCARTVSLWVF